MQLHHLSISTLPHTLRAAAVAVTVMLPPIQPYVGFHCNAGVQCRDASAESPYFTPAS